MPREALKKLDGLAKTFENDYPSTEKGYQEMKKHREGLTATIEQALNEYEELKRDVKRFMELLNKDPKSTTNRESFEVVTLGEKLSKVGKEE